eukprot:TRINITY_DN2080_c0_g1_i4.p1 TRINITY_DN2080_c0_g1~~TRINITY_DN2080_c0_g1_i4.p1  ORF type:complete len:115 (+),score=37.06 TRINITY_DN2080_c0_g1_i4:76-420(+)
MPTPISFSINQSNSFASLLQFLQYHLAEERATAQRLDNVISKFGTPNEDDREDVIRLLSEDILEALLEDEPDAYVSLEQFEMGRLNKELKLLADEVCGDSLYFMSISEKEKLEE